MELEFKLSQDYIELYKLLKVTNIAATGGHGKILIDEGDVLLNGETEYRKRAKIRKGDLVECDGKLIRII